VVIRNFGRLEFDKLSKRIGRLEHDGWLMVKVANRVVDGTD
jgi:hypothetical protein